MKIAVVADAHIRDDLGEVKQFSKLLNYLVNEKFEKIILLGDIFDFYCDNNRKLHPAVKELAEVIESTSEKVELYFIEGNHEFGIYLKGVKIFRNFLSLKCNGKKCFFSHGHEYASLNPFSPFLNFISHSPMFSSLVTRIFPPSMLWKVAVRLSTHSRLNGKIGSEEINRRLQKYLDIFDDYDFIFFAHSHLKTVKRKGKKILITVGAWCNNRDYCVVEDNRIRFEKWVEK
jgi:predicted phosphodiesterase